MGLAFLANETQPHGQVHKIAEGLIAFGLGGGVHEIIIHVSPNQGHWRAVGSHVYPTVTNFGVVVAPFQFLPPTVLHSVPFESRRLLAEHPQNTVAEATGNAWRFCGTHGET